MDYNLNQNQPNIPNQPPNQSPQAKHISTLVGSIIIITVAVIAFSGVFAWQYFNTKQFQSVETALQTQQILDKQFPLVGEENLSNETAGWKIYKNNEYGFEIKYPSDWSIDQTAVGVFIYCDYQKRNLEPCAGLQGVGIGSPGPSVSIRVDKIDFENFKKDFVIQKQESYLLNEIKGWKILGAPSIGEGWPFNTFFATKDNNSYIISYPNEKAQILDQIFSTFKFAK